MNLKPIARGTAAGLCLLPAIALSQLLVHEPFDYAPGANALNGTSGGFGFNSAWDNGGTDIIAPGASYSDGFGRELIQTGNAALSDAVQSFRTIATEMAAIDPAQTTLYLSVIAERVSGGAGRFTNISLFEGTTERVSVGHWSGQANWAVNFGGSGANGSASSTPASERAFLVMRLDVNVDGTANERLRLYVNPPLGQGEPESPDADITSSSNFLTSLGVITRVRIASGGANETNPATHALYDELRIGLGWDDVTPSDEALPTVTLQSAQLTRTGGTIVLTEKNGAVVDEDEDFLLVLTDSMSGDELETSNLVVSREGETGTTTLTFDASPAASTTYDLYLVSPRADTPVDDVIWAVLQSHLLPDTLPGPAGTVGSWGIREYTVSGTNSVAAALAVIDEGAAPVTDGSAPVFNHTDPNSSTALNTGNFNNDLPILSDAAGNQDWVVIGKTQLNIPAPGTYTFSVHSDDGFAMRITGAGGGSFISRTGAGFIDPADSQVIAFNGPTGDSNTRGVYQFDAAGTYDLVYLGWDGSGHGFHEVAWAQGAFAEDKDTNTWTLVGNPNDPSIPAFRPRFTFDFLGPAGTAGNFGIRTYLQAATTSFSIASLTEFLRTTTRQPGDENGLTIDVQRPSLNAVDPDGVGASGVITPNDPFPGDTPGVNEDYVVTSAKGRISVTDAGFYTFWIHNDDGCIFRIKGVDGTFSPSFKRIVGTGTFQMSNPNEMTSGTGNSRVIVFLAAGNYDIDFALFENTGGFGYELVSAKGEWPTGTPPTGWQLVGFNPFPTSLILPKIVSENGWTLESSQPNLQGATTTIATAEAAIDATLALDPVPAEAVTFWPRLDFRDLPGGAQGSFNSNTGFPFDNPTAADTNYANRATGVLEITVPGEYHLGFQGDDGGYMQIDAITGPPAEWIDIHQTLVGANAVIVDAEGGTRNRLQADITTGNSRTIGRINLGVGTYAIKTLVFQGGGGSWWEVIGSQATNVANYAYPLLASDGPATVEVTPGLPLVTQVEIVDDGGFAITGLSLSGTPVSAASFSFSHGGETGHTIQVSTDLQEWTTVAATITDNGDGTSSVTLGFAGQTVNGDQPLTGQPKLFIRVVAP